MNKKIDILYIVCTSRISTVFITHSMIFDRFHFRPNSYRWIFSYFFPKRWKFLCLIIIFLTQKKAVEKWCTKMFLIKKIGITIFHHGVFFLSKIFIINKQRNLKFQKKRRKYSPIHLVIRAKTKKNDQSSQNVSENGAKFMTYTRYFCKLKKKKSRFYLYCECRIVQ